MTGTNWCQVADALAERMANHAFCDSHPPRDADANCPFCADRAAYCRYLTAGGTDTRDLAVHARHVTIAELLRPSGTPYPTHPFAGTSSERQSVGLPGHCERCAQAGHVKAHPSLGCGDVGCEKAHGPDDEAPVRP